MEVRFRFLFCIIAPLIFLSESFAEDPFKTVKIGVIAPLTGGLAGRGEDISRLIEVIEPVFNKSSLKYQYKFVLDDGCCGAGNASTTIAQKFINVDGIKFLITTCSGETLQAGPIAQKKGIVTFAVLSTHQDIKKLGNYVFRTFIDIERGIDNFAARMKKQSGKVAVLTEENAFTFGIKKLLHKYLDESVVYSDDFSVGTTDFKTILARIRSSGAKGVYFNVMSEGTLAVLVNQSRALGLDYQIYSYTMPEASTFIGMTGKNSEGLEYLGSPVINDASEDFKRILVEYLKKYPKGPEYQFLLRTFYDAAFVTIKGIEKTGPNPQKVRDFIADYKGTGALGKISFDNNGDVEGVNYQLKRIENGKSILIEDL